MWSFYLSDALVSNATYANLPGQQRTVIIIWYHPAFDGLLELD